MGHHITAIILKGEFDAGKAESYDLFAVPLIPGLTLFHIDHYWSACWQYKLQSKDLLDLSEISSIVFPSEKSIALVVTDISAEDNVEYAIIQTDYFGGIGEQWANVFINYSNADKAVSSINEALRFLGVNRRDGLDEFDTVGLGNIRSQPDYLDKYTDLADEFGV